MPSVVRVARRVLDVLERDEALKARMGKGGVFRFGGLASPTMTISTLPLIHVSAAAPSYMRSRRPVGGSVGTGVAPREIITYVIHAVCVNRPQAGKASYAQSETQDLADLAILALKRNPWLRDADGEDPLAHTLEVDSQLRNMSDVGTEIEAVTVIVWVTTHVDADERLGTA